MIDGFIRPGTRGSSGNTGKMMRKQKLVREVSRQELYDLVWQRPMCKVAPEFGLSGNGLAKLCRRKGIPVPERGYWAKLAHGKRVKRPSLQPVAGDPETLTIQVTPPQHGSLESSMPEPLATLLQAERAALDPIAIPNFQKPHPLVETWPRPQKPSYGVPWFTAEGESRRRRIASALFREIERRGGKVSVTKNHEQDTHRFSVTFFNETIEVFFRELTTMVKVPPDPRKSYSYESTEYHPTGRLRLRFENYLDVPIRREWNDRETKQLEERLREILIALYIAVEAERLRNERFRLERQREAEAVERRWKREERQRRERESLEALLKEATAWDNAQRVRRYVAAVCDAQSRPSDWIKRALIIAEKLDPIKHKN